MVKFNLIITAPTFIDLWQLLVANYRWKIEEALRNNKARIGVYVSEDGSKIIIDEGNGATA